MRAPGCHFSRVFGCFICVFLQNGSFVWFKSVTESERGCAAGNCFLFTLKSRSWKLNNQPEKVASRLYLCAHVCVWEREGGTRRMQDICEVTPHEVFLVCRCSGGTLWFCVCMCVCGWVSWGWDKQTAGLGSKGQTATQSQRRWKMCTLWG